MSHPQLSVGKQANYICAQRPRKFPHAGGQAVPPEPAQALDVVQTLFALSVEGYINDAVPTRIDAQQVSEPVAVGVAHEGMARRGPEIMRPGEAGRDLKVGPGREAEGKKRGPAQ